MCKLMFPVSFLCSVLMVCLLLTAACADAADNSGRHEKYEERVLFVGEYGTGINQLRMRQPSGREGDVEWFYPPCMSVAPGGTVLIADQFNGLIKRFSVSGEVLQTIPVDTSLPYIGWLSVDASGNIHYLRELNWLVTYNSKGDHLGEISLSADGPVIVDDMTLAEGDLYVRGGVRGVHRDEGLRYDSGGVLRERRPEHPELWVATAGRYFVEADSVVDHGDIPLEAIRTADGEPFAKSASKGSRSTECLGVDKDLNLYLEEYRGRQKLIVKYDRHGGKVAEIEVRDVYSPGWGGYQLVWLCPDGTIYALVTIDDYYHWAVYKYSPIEKSGE